MSHFGRNRVKYIILNYWRVIYLKYYMLGDWWNSVKKVSVIGAAIGWERGVRVTSYTASPNSALECAQRIYWRPKCYPRCDWLTGRRGDAETTVIGWRKLCLLCSKTHLDGLRWGRCGVGEPRPLAPRPK